MKGRKFLKQVVWVIVIALLLVGCGASASTPIPPTDTPTPVPLTPTPTSEPLPEYDPDTILVTFTGDECTSSVPAELPVGEHQFVLRDLSENNPEFILTILHLIDGHTYQDLLDLQSEPGVDSPHPDWARYIERKLVGGKWPNDKVYIISFEKEGEYGLSTGALYREYLWFCGSFQVVEVPSE